MVAGHICLANGSISLVRTRRIPMVSSLAAAISEIALDAADHRLDCEHYPHLRHVALAHTWASLGAASRLGNAAGIRMRGNSCRNDRFAPDKSIGRPYNGQRTYRVKPTGTPHDFYAPKKCLSSFNMACVSFIGTECEKRVTGVLQAHSFFSYGLIATVVLS